MTKGQANQRVVVDRLDWVQRMVDEIRLLPLGSLDEFTGDRRNIGAAESCLRRALEALLDLGRHLLSKVYGGAVTEYKEIARELERRNVLPSEPARMLLIFAGYRNRLVHFYHEITEEEMFHICSKELDDLLTVKDAFSTWLKTHPEHIDKAL
jgi:uncharacterized protein YutE (UPF0331/DUF86 family)